MTSLAIFLYEVIFTVIFFGLILSQEATFLKYFPTVSLSTRIILLCGLFSGFFIPYFINALRIKLKSSHYLLLFFLVSFLYVLSSRYYYAQTFAGRNFHPFLQLIPTEQKSVIPKPTTTFRIICLGGSTTEGFQSKGYPLPLQRMLSEKYPELDIEVINAGKYFYSTQHSIIQYLFYLKELEPNLVIIFEAANDLITSFTMPPFSSKPFRRDYGHFYGPLANIRYPETFEQFLSQFLFADLRRPHLTPLPFNDFQSKHSFRRNLETIIEITRCEKISLILSNQAHCLSENNDSDPDFLGFQKYLLVDRKHYADERSWYQGMELFNGITKETAKKFSIPFVDQAAVLNGRRELFRESVHLTPEGTELLAGLFLEKIVELKLLEQSSTGHI